MRKLMFFIVAFTFLTVSSVMAEGKGYEVQFNQDRNDIFTLNISLDKYQVDIVEYDGEQFSKINFPGNVNLKQEGWADLPYFGIPVQLSPDRNVDVELVATEYVDIQLVHPMLPSRGVIYRNQEPDEIPYVTDPASIVDEWYPANLTEESEPYIIRKVRGENIMVYPFRYNAVTQTLRVYKNISIQVTENHDEPVNPLPQNLGDVNREMSPVYSSMFVNYNQNHTRWAEEIGEFGDILVIYTSRDATVIQPWIEWKQQKGYNVDELQVSTGTNVSSDIQTAYDANNNLLYVLLVGDWADVKSDLGPDSAPTDPMMGCVVGTDDHHDIIIGRFSAESTTDVNAQVDKTIEYERDAAVGSTWYKNALGIASDEGTGDDGEWDTEQISNIHNDRLLATTYTTCHEVYDPGASATTVQSHINSGVSVINYCGHGGHDYWVSSSYSASNAGASTNDGMYYYAFSVACVVGEFHTGADCLAEGMMRKYKGGAVATWMSTINQPWQPPMRGQDYANDLLIQGFNYSAVSASGTSTTYGRTTFGSITFNAAELMVAESGASDDWDTYKTWTIFGDPSVQVRTDEPSAISLTNMSVTPGTYTTQVQVGGSAFEGAIVSLWQSGSQPASAVTDASGNVSIDHSFVGTVKLTVTGFNLETYHADHVVAVPDPPVCDFSADQTVITAGEAVQFTDNSTNYPSTWNWTLTGGTPSSSNDQNPLVVYNTPGTYDVSLYVENTAGNDSEAKTAYITVNPVTEVPVSDFIADVTSVNIGGTVNFTDLSTNLPDSWAWNFEGGAPASSTDQNPSVVYNTPGTYQVELTASNSIGTGNTETKLTYITVILPDYCDAGSSSSSYEHLSNIVLGSIDNASGASTYTDHSSLSTDAAAGDDVALTATISNAYNSDQVLVWADWNRDGDFEDTDEDVYVSSTGQGPHSTTITVPLAATPGPVRVRIRLEDSSYGPVASPCGFSDYGEVEDYTINIVDNTPTYELTFDVTDGTNPVQGATVILTGYGTQTTDVSGLAVFSAVAEANDIVYAVTADCYDAVDGMVSVTGDQTENVTMLMISYDATINSVDPICESSAAITLTAAEAGGVWSGTGVSGDQFNPATAGAGNHVITYTLGTGVCETSDTETIHVDAQVDATINAVGPFCTADAAVTLSAASAAGVWSGTGVSGDQFDPATAGVGTHTITYNVTNGVCSDTDQIDIVVVDNYDATIDAVDPLCENDSPITLTAADAGGIWSGTGVSGDQFDPATAGAGDHTITYTVGTGACSDTDTEIIHVDAIPVVSITAVDPLCVDDAVITLSADVAGGVWSGTGLTDDQFDPATAGVGTHIITYTVSNGACTATVEINIVVGASPVVEVEIVNASSATATDGSATATVSGGLEPYTYEWSNADSDNVMEDVAAGTYSLTVTDAAGCETVVTDVLIDFTDGISENSMSYAVYPNPAETEVFVQLENMNADRIEVMNVLGQSVISLKPDSDLTRINLEGFESGVYFIRIHTSGEQFTQKLMLD